MKKFFPFIITIIFIGNIFSQCPGCVIDNTCPASKPNGGICKGVMIGMVAHAYSKDISIYMPKKINCAAIGMGAKCSYVELKKIKVSSITSPIGLSTTSDKTLYNVVTGDTIGCIKFCGTPLSAGTYPIVINLLADLKAYGTPGGDVDLFDQPFPYLDTIIILADTTFNAPITSFTYQLNGLTKNLSISKDCDSLVLDSLKALLTGDCNLTKYQWNIKGVGNFLGKIPIVNKIVYKIADTFPTKLTTQFYNYRIKKIEIGSVTGGYSEAACIAAMEECPLFGKPDLYLTIDVVAFSNRRNCGNAECDSNLNKDANIAFNNLNLTIPSNKCSNSFKLAIYDEDSAPFGTVLTFPANLAATADDKLDEYIVTPTLGTITLPNGSNTKTVKITFDTIPAGPPIIENMSIVIHPKPATTSVSSTQDSFCNTQNLDLNIANNGNYVEWYRDTTLLTGLNNNKITIQYHV